MHVNDTTCLSGNGYADTLHANHTPMLDDGTAAKLLDAFSWSYERWIQSPWFQQYHFTMDVDRQGGYTTTPKRPVDPGWGE